MEPTTVKHTNILKHLIRVLAVYRWTWIGVTAFTLLVAAVAVFTLTPRYRAECTVLIEPGKMSITEFKDVYDPTMSGGGRGDAREFTETQFHLMLSEPVLEKVFLRFGFGDMEPFRESSDPIKSFVDYFDVQPVKRTRLAKVTFEWRDPELAARALSFLVKTYIEEYRRRRLGVTTDGLVALQHKCEELGPEVEKKAAALQEFVVKHNMVSLEESHDIINERLKETSTNLTRVEGRRIQLESRFRNIAEALEGKRPLDDLPEVIDNPTIRDLKMERVRITQSVGDFGDRFGANHPEMRRMQAKRKAVESRIDLEIRSILAGAGADLDRARKQEAELREALADQEKRVMEQNRLGVQYNILKDAHASSNESYKSIIKRIEEIEIASAAGSKEDNVFEITTPKVPTEKAFPRKKQSLALAALLGLILGVGLSFLLHSLDGSLKTVEDVEDELGSPVLGSVPAVGKAFEEDPDLASLSDPRGPFAESFRSLRTAMSLARAGETLRHVLITSPSPSEGKDLISVNTAIALASSGKRVLLIDGDMRRPRQHKVFGCSSSPGLSNLLAGHADEDPLTCICSTDVPGLSLLPSGPVPPNPLELLAAPRMLALLETLDASFDSIVINSPPVMAVSDPVVLGRMAHGVVLVIRAFSTRKENARRTLEVLRRAEVNLLGCVLNLVDVPRSAGGYYGYGNHAHYEYGNRPEEPEAKGPRRRPKAEVEAIAAPAAAFEE